MRAPSSLVVPGPGAAAVHVPESETPPGGPPSGPTADRVNPTVKKTRRPSARRIVIATVLIGVSVATSLFLFRSTDRSTSSIDGFLAQGAEQATPELAWIQYPGPDGMETIANGATIRLSDSLNLAVVLNPYPPSTLDFDMELYLTDADGSPVVDAEIAADWDMTVMPHGLAITDFLGSGDGRYTAAFDPSMFGPWVFSLKVTAPGHSQPEDLTLSINVWPE